jgi:flagellar biosynthesis/type III secretory pathway chaperone
MKKRLEVIDEKKKAIILAQKNQEENQKKTFNTKVEMVPSYTEFVDVNDWWTEIEKVIKDKISVRPTHDVRESD